MKKLVNNLGYDTEIEGKLWLAGAVVEVSDLLYFDMILQHPECSVEKPVPAAKKIEESKKV